MKRQHPDNPELFWCHICNTFKDRYKFETLHDYRPCCDCLSDGSCANARSKKYEYQRQREIEYMRKYALTHKKEYHDRYQINKRLLRDPYIKKLLRTAKQPSKELIEIKRQEVIAKRTLNDFKNWRKENDSTITDVPGIEQENEAADGLIRIRDEA